jgi:DNA-binding NtrC family response regulator
MGFVECQRRSDVRVYAPGCLMERKHDCAEGNRFVVDDDPAVCTALKRLIRSVGIEALTFTSGGDFLRATRLDVPGCLVLDVRLPDLSGLNLQEKLTEARSESPYARSQSDSKRARAVDR